MPSVKNNKKITQAVIKQVKIQLVEMSGFQGTPSQSSHQAVANGKQIQHSWRWVETSATDNAEGERGFGSLQVAEGCHALCASMRVCVCVHARLFWSATGSSAHVSSTTLALHDDVTHKEHKERVRTRCSLRAMRARLHA